MNFGLSNDQIKAVAPSVFATKPWEGVSSRYAFIPTVQVLDALRDSGFACVRAMQSRCRIAGKKPFTKHMLRFRNKEDLGRNATVVNGNAHYIYKPGEAPELVEIVLTNAHDRSSAYHLDAGIFRLVCSNGLVLKSHDFGGISIMHTGDVVEDVLKGTKSIISRAGKINGTIEQWKAAPLPEPKRLEMAEAALILRWGMDSADNLLAPVGTQDVLLPRRPEDSGKDLWTTTNVIQENLMRGQIAGRSASGRRTTTRPITSVNNELDINRNVWALAEVMAENIFN